MNRREFLKVTLLGAMAAAVPVLAREPEPLLSGNKFYIKGNKIYGSTGGIQYSGPSPLSVAMSNAKPGDVFVLAPGIYTGNSPPMPSSTWMPRHPRGGSLWMAGNPAA